MPATNKKSSGVALKIMLPAELYRQAATRAAGISLHNYLTHLLYADLGIDPDTTEDVLYSRAVGWNTENVPATKRVQLIVSRPLHGVLKAKLAAFAYPVTISAYVRRLVERDVAERKVRLPAPR